MRTDPTEGAAPGRLRDAAARARAWLAGLGLVGRLALAVGLLAILAAAGQLASFEGREEVAWLYDGHRFAPEDAQRAVRALEAKAIAARAVGGRIEVGRSALSGAHAALDKAGLAPRGPRALLDDLPAPGLLPSRAEHEERKLRRREQVLERAIEQIDESLSALVRLYPERTRGLAPLETLRVTVELSVPGDAPVEPRLIEPIKAKVRAYEPGAAPEQLTIMDRQGNVYLSADKPEMARQSRLRAREEELRREILGGLDWIRGVHVQVRIAPAPAGAEAPAGEAAAIAVNAPLDEAPEAAAEAAAAGRATVIVRVPSSYYLNHYDAVAARREPAAGDLALFEAAAKETIRKAVALVVTPEELGDLEIDRIYDSEPEVARPPARARGVGWPSAEWLPAAGVVAGVAGLLVAGWLGRRLRQGSAPRPAAAGRRRLRADGASDPVERARELVRLDPAAAAGVLQRWVGQAEGNDR